ncbi:iron ABC transporter permease [Desulfosporosinus sp. PR]|uniref:FecCD family ABC transporter permease n=1 Tax=Candidatus Desulfosporosinus nitrosoreducens TaxID=3401928 RepID=UPI0027FA4F39|nr:iron ABC transporter permease [Desulfosporosinus sp. PR]MDQ7092200.1 iron ABC transporter permease [Desulfosporosinus sp. PR]
MTVKQKNLKVTWIALLSLLALTFFVSLFSGRYWIAPGEVGKILIDRFRGLTQDGMDVSVVWGIRMPRTLLNVLVGSGLAIAGAAFQGLFQNPLVSPDVLGVSSGAAFGAVFGILLAGINNFTTALALVFGIVSVFITYTLSKLRGESTTLSIVLSGMIISAVFSALISLIKYVADPYDKLPAITYWLMGSFANASYNNLKLVGVPILLGIVILLMLRWRINILSLGDEEAYSLGVNPVKTRLVIIIMATLVTASCVTVTGVIGWVGLVIPHISRMLTGEDHQNLLPASGIVGAIFMIIVDMIARTATAAEIPIGILTALVGAPFFAILFKRSKGDWL